MGERSMTVRRFEEIRRGPIWMAVAVVSFIGLINFAQACDFDTDCGVGSHCLKAAE
jgi:hypothetical protein